MTKLPSSEWSQIHGSPELPHEAGKEWMKSSWPIPSCRTVLSLKVAKLSAGWSQSRLVKLIIPSKRKAHCRWRESRNLATLKSPHKREIP
jgi:hypothetical protein